MGYGNGKLNEGQIIGEPHNLIAVIVLKTSLPPVIVTKPWNVNFAIQKNNESPHTFSNCSKKDKLQEGTFK